MFPIVLRSKILPAALPTAGVFLLLRSLALAQAGEEQTPHRWAIVATDAGSAALADLLTVELSRRKDLQLVERQQIQKVLDELQLSAAGLVAPERTARFGQLSHADALLLLEAQEKPGPRTIRVCLVEAATSVRLLDVLLPGANIEKELEAVLGELQHAGDKLAVPEEQRRFVGVLGIKSEEPGETLTPFCRALTVLSEVRLQQHPKFVVLQRDQLQRLTAERDLTGAELRIRSAAWLLEAGVRRVEGGEGLLITGRLLSPASGIKKLLQIELPMRDLAAAQTKLAAAIEEAIGVHVEKVEDTDLAAEAALFARRRRWFRDSYRYPEAAEMAEVALALTPTPDNVREALTVYYVWAHAMDGPHKTHEALPAARRHHELCLEWYRKTTPGSELHKGLPAQPFEPHVRLPGVVAESDEDRNVRAEVDRLSKEYFDLLFAEAAENPARRLELLLQRLKYAAYLCETGQEFAETLPPLLDQIDRVFGELNVLREFKDPHYSTFAGLVFGVLNVSQENVDLSSRSSDTRDWLLREVTPLWERLAREDDPAIRAGALKALAAQRGERGSAAAGELLEIVKQWPVAEEGGRRQTDMLVNAALQSVPARQADAFVEQLITAAEKQQSGETLLRYPLTLFFYVGRCDRSKKQLVGERILSALEMSQLTKEQAYAAAGLRTSIDRHLQDQGLRSPPGFSLAAGEGPWQEYTARPIAIENKAAENFSLYAVFVDRRPAAKDNGELLLVWARKAKTLGVERVPLSGGTPRAAGPSVPGVRKPFHGVQVAVGPDATYIASGTPGFVVLRSDGFEVIDEAQGGPASEVLQLAWWKDRLYVAYRDALASFDPSTKSFRLIAAAGTVEPKNPLDGRGSFFVNTILPDEKNNCLWLSVQDNAPPNSRYGVWRMEPESGKFEQLERNIARISWADDGLLLHLTAPQPWAHVRTSTAQHTALAQYDPWTPPADIQVPERRFIQVGEHLIDGNGQLFTPDGKRHRVKTDTRWNLLQRVGPGFLTHFDEKANVLWYVEPKHAERAAGQTLPAK